ncbi:nucleotidyltransferase domain-containing protein [Bifidobacterium pseudocatenulatum]|nr:nucleotidyltransferase domain-containing protein [Bifidobacterium pseudocatenulatum]
MPTVSETLRWLTGSRAYGLALSDSDTDLRSISI